MKHKPFIFLVLLFFSISACFHKSKKTILTGKISNPRDSVIVIFSKLTREDARRIVLNQYNEFKIELPLKRPAFYTFLHGSYIGHFYIEPGDSVSLYFNALYFDESLYFSADQSIFNNLYTNLLLLDKKLINHTDDLVQQGKKKEFASILENFRTEKKKIVSGYLSRHPELLKKSPQKHIFENYYYLTELLQTEKLNYRLRHKQNPDTFSFPLHYQPPWQDTLYPSYYLALLGPYYFSNRWGDIPIANKEKLYTYASKLKKAVKNKALYDIIMHFFIRDLYLRQVYPDFNEKYNYLVSSTFLDSIFYYEITKMRTKHTVEIFQNSLPGGQMVSVTVNDSISTPFRLKNVIKEKPLTIFIPWKNKWIYTPTIANRLKKLVDKYGEKVLLVEVWYVPDYVKWKNIIKKEKLEKARNYYADFGYNVPYFSEKQLIYLVDSSMKIHNIVPILDKNLESKIDSFLLHGVSH